MTITFDEPQVNAHQAAEEKLEALALEGLNSGPGIGVGPGFRGERHRELDEKLSARYS
jgi:hypothetical protein